MNPAPTRAGDLKRVQANIQKISAAGKANEAPRMSMDTPILARTTLAIPIQLGDRRERVVLRRQAAKALAAGAPARQVPRGALAAALAAGSRHGFAEAKEASAATMKTADALSAV